MELNIDEIVSLWRNDFVKYYADIKPRLACLIRDCEFDVAVIEVEDGINMPFIRFYVVNEAYRQWIEERFLEEMQEVIAKIAGLELLSLSVEVSDSNDK